MSRSMRRWALAAPLLILASYACAQDRGSEADQEACTPDVFRLCSSDIPDEGRILACLQAKGASLSGACHKVIFRPSSKTPSLREADASTTASIPGRHHHRHHRRVLD